MTEIVIFFVFLIPVTLGLAEILHILKLFLLKPKKPIISYKVIFLTNESATEQLFYVSEQYLWQGRRNNHNLIFINSFLNSKNYEECKKITDIYNYTFCSIEELENYFKAL